MTAYTCKNNWNKWYNAWCERQTWAESSAKDGKHLWVKWIAGNGQTGCSGSPHIEPVLSCLVR